MCLRRSDCITVVFAIHRLTMIFSTFTAFSVYSCVAHSDQKTWQYICVYISLPTRHSKRSVLFFSLHEHSRYLHYVTQGELSPLALPGFGASWDTKQRLSNLTATHKNIMKFVQYTLEVHR